MILSRISIRRPVLATVMSLLLIVFGVGAILLLPVREFPDVDPPLVTVFTVYPGAAAEVVDRDVTDVVESAVGTVEGINIISSVSRDELSRIELEFDLERDLDAAAADVRDMVAQVRADLPEGAEDPIISKAAGDADPIMWLTLTSERDLLELTDYADRILVDQLSVVSGVADVIIGGGRVYALRIWLDRQAMASLNVTAQDVAGALRAENVELAAGRVESVEREFTVRALGRLQTPQEFQDLVLRTSDGVQITLGDIARVELGAESYRSGVFVNQQPAVGLGIVRQAGTNTLAVANGVKAAVEELRGTLPDDISLAVSYDVSEYIEGSIREVIRTLVIAAVLVIAVIFLFLRSARSTLVPAVTVPVSLRATFIVLYLLDLSIDTLTLLALILAIGLVVDDGIVVLENIVRRTELGEPLLLAASRGADQIGFAVIATTLVLVAVFLPLNFLGGEIGRLFGQFGIALAAAVTFSSFVALTAGAMLASKVVSVKKASLFGLLPALDKGFDALNRGYRRGLEATVAVPLVVVVMFVALSGLSYFLYTLLPQELAPVEDRGVIIIPVEAPQGSTFAYTSRQVEAIEQILDPYRGDDGPIAATISIIGLAQEGAAPTNEALIIVRLRDWADREIVQEDLANELMPELLALPGVQAFAVNPPPLGRTGFASPVQFVVAGTQFGDAQRWGQQVLTIAEQMPELVNPRINFEETRPQLTISIDRRRAADLGLSVRDIGETLQVMLSEVAVTEFEFEAQTYDVIPRAEPEGRATPEDLENIFVRVPATGALVPLLSVVNIEERGVANELQRVNRLPAVTISASLPPDVALGDALDRLEERAREILPAEARIMYLGLSEEYQRTRAGTYLAFGLAFIVIFLVLAGQFESFIHPVIVLLPAPLAVGGGLLALLVFGQSFNIFSQIALILVIGLMAKNAILVVEFANQMREKAMSVREAVVEAASVRMRPILMTSIATALGALPLALATGPGAENRHVIGIVVIGGITLATLLTLFMVPVFYILLARYARPAGAIARRIKQEEKDHARADRVRDGHRAEDESRNSG
jgi:multidrug efflux pump